MKKYIQIYKHNTPGDEKCYGEKEGEGGGKWMSLHPTCSTRQFRLFFKIN